MFLALLLSLCPRCHAQAAHNFFWSLFIKGKSQGNMKITTDGTEFTSTTRDSQLVMNVPDRSRLTYTFTLDSVPAQYYILNDWKSSPKRAIARIKINNQILSNMVLEYNNYLSQGFEISRLLRSGENTIDLELGSGSDELWIRGTILTENPSLARNVEFLPDLLPGYAKTFALILLFLGLLYLIWFFFNRTLYKNMDVFSASFSLIGIMIASVATAYCFLLVSKKIGFSIFFLVFTLILAIAAMISVKRTESGFKRSVATDTGPIGEDTSSGGDFNF